MYKSLIKLKALFDRRDMVVFSLIFLMMLVGAALEIIGVGSIPIFIGMAANPEKVMQYPLIRSVLELFRLTTSRDIIVTGSFVLIGIYLIKNSYLIFVDYCQLRVVKNKQVALGKRLFTAYMRAPYEFHIEHNSAELLRNVNVEVQRICTEVLLPIMIILMNAIITLAIFLVLAAVEPLISFLAVIILGIAGGGFLLKINQRMKKYGAEALEHRRGMVQIINQGIGSIKEVRLGHKENFFIEDFNYRANRSAIAQRFNMLAQGSSGRFLEFTAITTILLLAILLVSLGRSLVSIAPTLALLGVSLVRLKATINQLVSSYSKLNFNALSVHTVYDHLTLLKENKKILGAVYKKPIKLNEFIQVQNLSYKYPGAKSYALKGINLRINKGSSLAFVGSTGAGKTTIVDLVLGILPPTQGAIQIDGVDIRENIKKWQENIGYVPQFIYLIDDTIRHNIAFGLKDNVIDETKLYNAVCAAQLEEYVNSLPKSLDTIVGEDGVRLSGGQRQRIGIARALYENPEVLVMDEGTSALDNLTEKAVVDAVEALKGDRTIIMIAHRLSTVRNCDRLVFLMDGKIKAEGTYAELFESCEDFKSMSQG